MQVGRGPAFAPTVAAARPAYAVGPGKGVMVSINMGNVISVANRDLRFEEPGNCSDESADLRTLRASAGAAVGAPLY